MKRIVSKLIRQHDSRDVPIILFTKNGGQWLSQIADAGAHAIGLDWTIEIGAAKKLVEQSALCKVTWTHQFCTRLQKQFARK